MSKLGTEEAEQIIRQYSDMIIGERRFLCLSSVPKKQNKLSGSILT